MITGTKVLKHLDNLTSRRPITAQIQLVNFCNNRCEYCRYVDMHVKEQKAISFEEFKQYVCILRGLGVKGFILTGGEPTLSKDFDKITHWLEMYGIPYGINTNFNVLKFIRPRYLKISIDGYNSTSYKEVRKVDKYEMTIENVRKYLEWRDLSKGVKTKVGLQMLGVDPEGCERFYKAHKDLNVDYMSFRPVESVGGEFYQSRDEKAVLGVLERLRAKDKRVQINYKFYQLREKFTRCYGNFLQIVVNQYGEVIYCCHKSDEVVGHITDPDILLKMAAYQTNMASCPVPCRMTGPNILVRDMEEITSDSMFI